MRAFAPNGSQIIGTLETVSARAEIIADSFRRGAPASSDPDVEFDWQGGTEIFYDGQETVVRDGQRIFLAEDGNEWPENQLALCDEEDVVMVQARFLKEGDRVDLGGDDYADPRHENQMFAARTFLVNGVERETAECMSVDFDGLDTIGFPTNHPLRVSEAAPGERKEHVMVYGPDGFVPPAKPKSFPLPWSFEGRGLLSALVDRDGETIIEVPWDGKDIGDGGVNDTLLSFADAAQSIGALRQTYTDTFPRLPTAEAMMEITKKALAITKRVLPR